MKTREWTINYFHLDSVDISSISISPNNRFKGLSETMPKVRNGSVAAEKVNPYKNTIITEPEDTPNNNLRGKYTMKPCSHLSSTIST